MRVNRILNKNYKQQTSMSGTKPIQKITLHVVKLFNIQGYTTVEEKLEKVLAFTRQVARNFSFARLGLTLGKQIKMSLSTHINTTLDRVRNVKIAYLRTLQLSLSWLKMILTLMWVSVRHGLDLSYKAQDGFRRWSLSEIPSITLEIRWTGKSRSEATQILYQTT